LERGAFPKMNNNSNTQVLKVAHRNFKKQENEEHFLPFF